MSMINLDAAQRNFLDMKVCFLFAAKQQTASHDMTWKTRSVPNVIGAWLIITFDGAPGWVKLF